MILQATWDDFVGGTTVSGIPGTTVQLHAENTLGPAPNQFQDVRAEGSENNAVIGDSGTFEVIEVVVDLAQRALVLGRGFGVSHAHPKQESIGMAFRYSAIRLTKGLRFHTPHVDDPRHDRDPLRSVDHLFDRLEIPWG